MGNNILVGQAEDLMGDQPLGYSLSHHEIGAQSDFLQFHSNVLCVGCYLFCLGCAHFLALLSLFSQFWKFFNHNLLMSFPIPGLSSFPLGLP